MTSIETNKLKVRLCIRLYTPRSFLFNSEMASNGRATLTQTHTIQSELNREEHSYDLNTYARRPIHLTPVFVHF